MIHTVEKYLAGECRLHDDILAYLGIEIRCLFAVSV